MGEPTKLEVLRSRVLTRMQDARCPDYPKLCGNEDCGMEAVILAKFEEAAREEAKHPTCETCVRYDLKREWCWLDNEGRLPTWYCPSHTSKDD